MNLNIIITPEGSSKSTFSVESNGAHIGLYPGSKDHEMMDRSHITIVVGCLKDGLFSVDVVDTNAMTVLNSFRVYRQNTNTASVCQMIMAV